MILVNTSSMRPSLLRRDTKSRLALARFQTLLSPAPILSEPHLDDISFHPIDIRSFVPDHTSRDAPSDSTWIIKKAKGIQIDHDTDTHANGKERRRRTQRNSPSFSSQIKRPPDSTRQESPSSSEIASFSGRSASTRASLRDKASLSASKDTSQAQYKPPQSSDESQRVLSRSEEFELIQVVQEYFELRKLKDEGSLDPQLLTLGEQALRSLITHNLGLVRSIAQKYYKMNSEYSLCLDDLIEEGKRGLLKAIKRFDQSRGFKLSTYATWWITNFIQRSIHFEAGLIRLPDNDWRDVDILATATRELLHSLGRSPTDKEIMAHLSSQVKSKWTLKKISYIRHCLNSLKLHMKKETSNKDEQRDEAEEASIAGDDDENSKNRVVSGGSGQVDAEQYVMGVLADLHLKYSLAKLTNEEERAVRLRMGWTLSGNSVTKLQDGKRGREASHVLMADSKLVPMSLVAEMMGVKNKQTASLLVKSGVDKLNGDKELSLLFSAVLDKPVEKRMATRSSGGATRKSRS